MYIEIIAVNYENNYVPRA